MARTLLSHNYFSDSIILYLKKSGTHFIYAGLFSLTSLVLFWINKLSILILGLVLEGNILTSLFLIIIGIFFIIQSNTLNLAKEIKEENELTV